MIKCPFCTKEFNKITSNHLKKHGIDYIDYLKEYEKDKYYIQVVADFIWSYYKPNTNKYIEQVLSKNSKKYEWTTQYAMGRNYLDIEKERADKEIIESNKLSKLNRTRPYPFSKSDIIKHLRKETTLGIYTSNGMASFLTFDIDEDNADYVEAIYTNLRCFEICDNEILISYSGNKGYHITIFFDKPIMLEDILNGSKCSFLDKKISMGKIEKKAQAVLDTSCAFCLGFKYAQKT